MSIHKNAFIPLLIAEDFYLKYPSRLNKVYIFCKEKLPNNSYIQNMRLIKDDKVETFGRMVMPFTLDAIQKNNKFKTVILSYTLLNNLNFVHLESMYIGVPIVHNCKPFDNLLHFDDNNLKRASELLEKARILNDTSKRVAVICKYNSKNITIQNIWEKEILKIIN
jgi:hypothetical protein